MQILWQLAIIFAFGLLGGVVSSILPVTVPASVLGLLFLFLALRINVLKVAQLAPTAAFLSANMAFFFLPSVVNIMQNYHLIQPVLWRLLIVCLLTTVIVFFTTYLVTYSVRAAMEKMKKIEKGEAADGTSF